MKWTQTKIVDSAALERHEFTYDIHDLGGVDDAIYGLLVNHGEGGLFGDTRDIRETKETGDTRDEYPKSFHPLHPHCQLDEFLYAELLGAFIEDRVLENLGGMFGLPFVDEVLKAVAECLASGAKGILDESAEVFLFAWKRGDAIARHLDHSRLHLGWWIEDAR